jgi:hypothetical protein
MVMVPVTAMPNAYARAEELRKANTRISTPTTSTALIDGTYTWPKAFDEVCITRNLGRYPS